MEIEQMEFDTLNPKIDDILNDDMGMKIGPVAGRSGRLAFALVQDGVIHGGITGTLTFQGFHINGLGLDECLRGQGYGTKLVGKIESEAIKSGAKLLTVSTQDYQALGFYEKLGYEVFGKLDGWPFDGATKYYLKKKVGI